MELFIFWVVMAAVVAMIAHHKGQVTFAWFIYGFLLWPIALVHILIKAPDRRVTDERAVRSGEMQRCPACAELIRREAKICRFCGRDVAEPAVKAAEPDQVVL